MTIPHAIFGGLALIALSIYFSAGSLPLSAAGGIQKVVICDPESHNRCVGVSGGDNTLLGRSALHVMQTRR
jgi:hypothetical protein